MSLMLQICLKKVKSSMKGLIGTNLLAQIVQQRQACPRRNGIDADKHPKATRAKTLDGRLVPVSVS